MVINPTCILAYSNPLAPDTAPLSTQLRYK